MLKKFVCWTVLLCGSVAACAQGLGRVPQGGDHGGLQPYTPLRLASAGNADMTADGDAAADPESAQGESWFTANKVHEYLGLGSLLLAGAAIVAPKEGDEGNGSSNSNSGAHHNLATGAAVLGAGAVLTGVAFHFDDIKFSRGLRDPDNLHALLATIGALGFAMAVSQAPEDSHAAYGIVGAVSMAAAIKITW